MARKQPSDLELQVLGVLWRGGPLPVRGVMEAMPDGKKRAYTTLLSVLQVMEKKGLVSHSVDGRTHVFKPCVTERQVLRPLFSRLVDHVFGGEPVAAVQGLLENAEVSDEELAEIRRLIDDQSGEGEA